MFLSLGWPPELTLLMRPGKGEYSIRKDLPKIIGRRQVPFLSFLGIQLGRARQEMGEGSMAGTGSESHLCPRSIFIAMTTVAMLSGVF